MANVFPFPAFRYTAKAGPIHNLVTQPYDKIPPDLQQKYYDASPNNFVRLTKGREKPGDNDANNVYTRSADDLEAWVRGGVLAQDAAPAFYPYFQQFKHPESGEVLVRQGFIGLTLDLLQATHHTVL